MTRRAAVFVGFLALVLLIAAFMAGRYVGQDATLKQAWGAVLVALCGLAVLVSVGLWRVMTWKG